MQWFVVAFHDKRADCGSSMRDFAERSALYSGMWAEWVVWIWRWRRRSKKRSCIFFFFRIGMGGRWRVAVVGMKSFSETDEKG